LFLIGGGLSVLLAYWGMGVMRSSIPSSIPRIHEIGINVGVLVFSLGISLVTGLVFGLVPALLASKTDFVESLKQGRGTTQGGRSGLRQLLVISQFALTLILANGAALMLQSYWQLRYTDHGFDTAGILTLRLNLQGAKYEKASQVHAFYNEVLDQIESIPGVRRAAAINRLPLEGGYNSTMIIEGREDAFGDSKGPLVEVKPITPAYFEVMGIPLIAGRGLTPQDGAGERIGVVINQTLARVGWPDENPMGQRFRYRHDSGTDFTVVGVVGDTRQWGLEREPISETYFPYTEVSALDMHTFREVEFIVVRTDIDPYSVVPDIRREIGSIDDDLPISDIRTTETLVTESIAKRRFNTILVILFATLGLVLVAAGIFGVMSFFVHQRTHEIGVRMALGANRSRVLTLVLSQSIKLAGIGITVGLLGVFATMKLTDSMVYGVHPTDPWTLFGGILFLVAVGLLASVAPARRAVAVEPVLALRQE
jgi:predicted permease